MKMPSPFAFRRTDGRAVYRFEPETLAPPVSKRTDLDLRCLRTSDGWRIVDTAARCSGGRGTTRRRTRRPPVAGSAPGTARRTNTS